MFSKSKTGGEQLKNVPVTMGSEESSHGIEWEVTLMLRIFTNLININGMHWHELQWQIRDTKGTSG